MYTLPCGLMQAVLGITPPSTALPVVVVVIVVVVVVVVVVAVVFTAITGIAMSSTVSRLHAFNIHVEPSQI